MKLRLKDNSLRLRLTRSEIVQLNETGSMQSETDFGDAPFRYEIVSSTDALIAASFAAGAITVHVPKAQVAQWAGSSEVGLYGGQAVSTGLLTIALEKDFRCLDPQRDEDESDHFDNPLAGATQHSACGHESD